MIAALGAALLALTATPALFAQNAATQTPPSQSGTAAGGQVGNGAAVLPPLPAGATTPMIPGAAVPTMPGAAPTTAGTAAGYPSGAASPTAAGAGGAGSGAGMQTLCLSTAGSVTNASPDAFGLSCPQ